MAIVTNLSLEELIYLNGSITGGQYFQNLIQSIAVDLTEKRFNTYSIPLFEGQLGDLLLDEEEMTYLQDFFIRRRGSEQGFLWRNPIDYTATPYKEGVLDVDPNTWTTGGVMEAPGEFTIKATPAKVYHSQEFVTKKPIYFPVDGKVDLYEAGVFSRSAVVSDGQFDYFGDPSNLSLKMEFNTPIWFVQNQFPSVIQGVGDTEDGLFKISSIPIKERLVQFAPQESFLPN